MEIISILKDFPGQVLNSILLIKNILDVYNLTSDIYWVIPGMFGIYCALNLMLWGFSSENFELVIALISLLLLIITAYMKFWAMMLFIPLWIAFVLYLIWCEAKKLVKRAKLT